MKRGFCYTVHLYIIHSTRPATIAFTNHDENRKVMYARIMCVMAFVRDFMLNFFFFFFNTPQERHIHTRSTIDLNENRPLISCYNLYRRT